VRRLEAAARRQAPQSHNPQRHADRGGAKTARARLAPALGEIESGLDVVNGFRDRPRGALRLNVPVIVAMKMLPSIANRFLRAYPGVTLEIAASDDFIDVVAAGFDARIRYEERIERDMIASPIGPRVQRYIAAAAPAYLTAHGVPSHPRDLVRKDMRDRLTPG
jgi:DNA-binding transcriptional LysR family regulator